MLGDKDAAAAADVLRLDRCQLIRFGAALSAVGGFIAVRSASGQVTTPMASPTGCTATHAGSPSASPAASPGAAVTVEMTQELRFDPQDPTIHVGQTVRWVNASAMPHNATHCHGRSRAEPG